MSKKSKPSEEDVGAAMMAWFADCLEQYPDGLITQAQAAVMLGIGRVPVSRLVARGYLRAVYFPKPPDIVGIAIGHDDPTWLKVMARLGWEGESDPDYAFPKACYVSFSDVVELWKSGDAKKKCSRDWNEIMANFMSREKRFKRLKEIFAEKQREAEAERNSKRNQITGTEKG
jgi:hypothetical protein